MAKSLSESIASALSTDRVTITTLEDLIPKAEGERDRLSEAHIRASSDSVDFALSEEDREEAALTAERCSRNAKAIGNAIDQLQAKLKAKRESDGRKAADAERAAALAERDDLVEHWRSVPELVGQLTELFIATQRNIDRMRAAGVGEADAEAKARGVPGFLGLGGGPASYLKMKIPTFDGPGRCWPPENRVNLDLGRDQYLADLRKSREERARWRRFIVSPPEKAGEPVTIETQRGPLRLHHQPVIAVMCEEGAKAARKLGCSLEFAAPNVSLGLPGVSSF